MKEIDRPYWVQYDHGDDAYDRDGRPGLFQYVTDASQKVWGSCCFNFMDERGWHAQYHGIGGQTECGHYAHLDMAMHAVERCHAAASVALRAALARQEEG